MLGSSLSSEIKLFLSSEHRRACYGVPTATGDRIGILRLISRASITNFKGCGLPDRILTVLMDMRENFEVNGAIERAKALFFGCLVLVSFAIEHKKTPNPENVR